MAGEIIYHAGATPPAGALVANGALVSRTSYAALFAAIGTQFGAGDGTTTFALPDMRGEFIRGLDSGRGVDAARILGSAQAASTVAAAPYAATSGASSANSVLNGDGVESSTSQYRVTSSATQTLVNNIYIRPRNIALLPCIVY